MIITLAGSAVAYVPNDTQLGGLSLEFAAFDGEVGTGQIPMPDSAAALNIDTGRQARVDEGTALLTDGFIIDHDRTRGPEPAGTAREYSYSVVDANALMDGFRVSRARPAESDYTRLMAFAANDGPDWDTTWVLNSSTVSLPAKTYFSDGGWSELITDLVEFTGKTIFLHDKANGSGRCLHWHVLTTGHTCGLQISDVFAAVNGTTVYAPQNPQRQRTSVDLVNDIRGDDADGRHSFLTDAASKTAHDADGLRHEAQIEFDTETQADLDLKTAAFLASQKEDRDTYTCAIGPLDATALNLIRVGDVITVTSSVMGLTASPQRIAHMTLTVYPAGSPAPGLWLAQLEMGAPIRRKARVKGKTPPAAIPTPPPLPNPTPGTTGCDIALAIRDTMRNRDIFDPDPGSWGTTSDGHGSWAIQGGPGDWSSGMDTGDDGFGFIHAKSNDVGGYINSLGYELTPVGTGPWLRPFNMTCSVRIDALGSTPGTVMQSWITFGAHSAQNGDGPCVVIDHLLDPGEELHFSVNAEDGGGGDSTAMGLTYGWYRVRFNVDGTTIKGKMWVEGTPEPVDWMVSTPVAEIWPLPYFELKLNYGTDTFDADDYEVGFRDLAFDCEGMVVMGGATVGTPKFIVAGTGDGAETDFTLPGEFAYEAGTLTLFDNGSPVDPADFTETSPGDGTYAFDTAPASGHKITALFSVAVKRTVPSGGGGGGGATTACGVVTDSFGPGTYASLGALSSGDVWEFDPAAIITDTLEITVDDVCIIGGIWTQAVETVQGFSDVIKINGANNVTIRDATFIGGDIQIGVHESDNTQIINTIHQDRSNAAIYFWGETNGCHDAIVEGFDIQPAAVAYASAIGSQGPSIPPATPVNSGIIIRDGSVDQGADGHFGIELIQTPDTLIHNVSMKNGECLSSFPRSPRVVVQHCDFDLRGMNTAFPANPGWGIEFASSVDCVAQYNTFLGDGPAYDQHAVACDTNGDRVVVKFNTATNLTALVDGGGVSPIITDNCVNNVGQVLAFASEAPGATLARNDPC